MRATDRVEMTITEKQRYSNRPLPTLFITGISYQPFAITLCKVTDLERILPTLEFFCAH